jgi:hypothetical protein
MHVQIKSEGKNLLVAIDQNMHAADTSTVSA